MEGSGTLVEGHQVSLIVESAEPDDELDEVSDEESKSPASSLTESRESLDKEQEEEEYCDTELETEETRVEYDVTGASLYLETCRRLGVVPISYVICHMTDERLVMKHHGLGVNGAKALSIPLASNTYILHLDLEENGLGSEGARYIAEMLKENCYIATLCISRNHLGSKGAAYVCDMLLTNSSVTSLDLSGNDFTDKDGPLMAAAILENGLVHTLNLSHNSFGCLAGSPLGHAIGENEILERIDLSWNTFRGDAGIAIVEGIKVNSRLKWVNLSWNGLGDEAAPALTDCLKQNHVLLELDISSNRISTDSAYVIAKGLDANETLKVMKIGKNPIAPPGAVAILNAVYNDRSVLQHLDLTDICVDKEFAQVVKDIQQTREIMVKHGGILGDYVIKGPPKKRYFKDESDMTEEDLESFREMLSAQSDNTMGVLHVYQVKRELNLISLFSRYDIDESCQIRADKFKMALATLGIELSESQIDGLWSSLVQQGAVEEGYTDYGYFVKQVASYEIS